MMSEAMFDSTERGLKLLRKGKVRDVYEASDEYLLIVACDRISAFDSVLPTPIPDKGKILTQISNFWFTKSEHIIKNHIVDPNPGPKWFPDIDWYYPELDGRTVLVQQDRAAGHRGHRARLPLRAVAGRSTRSPAPCATSSCPAASWSRTSCRR